MQLSLSDVAQYLQRGSNRAEEQASVPFQICRHISTWDLNVGLFFFFAVFLKAVVHFGNYILTGKLSLLGKYCCCLRDLSGFYSFICLFHSNGKNQIFWDNYTMQVIA